MRDIAIDVKLQPGELARIASALARQHVALRGGTLLAIGPRLVARFIPSDVDAARRALDGARVRFEEGEVVPVLLERRAGELAMLSTRLPNRRRSRPRLVSRLAHDRAVVALPQQLEEAADASGVACERRRQLHEQRTGLFTESGNLLEKPRQRIEDANERAIVRNDPLNFDRE